MKVITPIIIAASLLLLQGCIEIKTVVNVNRDGSGTVEETVVMSKMLVEMIASFTSSFADSTSPTEEFSLYNEEELRTHASEMGTDVQFVSGKELKNEHGEGYIVTYKFSDISGLIISQDPGSKISMPGGNTEKAADKEVMRFNFRKGEQPLLTIDLPQDKDKDEEESQDTTSFSESSDTSGMAQILPMLEGLRLSVSVNIDGQIVETNASHVNGSAVTLLDVNFAELFKNPAKLEELKKMNPTDLDDVKELVKTIPGFTIELNDPVTITFK